MLPRLEEKGQYKELGTYRAFTREILKRKNSNSNIAKLKMLKQFLDFEPEEKKRESIPIIVPKLSLEGRLVRKMQSVDKENESGRFKGRKASTAENESEQAGEIKMESERERSIFSMPENKFKLSELMKWGGGKYRRNQTKDCLNCSLRMNDKLSYNRIL